MVVLVAESSEVLLALWQLGTGVSFSRSRRLAYGEHPASVRRTDRPVRGQGLFSLGWTQLVGQVSLEPCFIHGVIVQNSVFMYFLGSGIVLLLPGPFIFLFWGNSFLHLFQVVTEEVKSVHGSYKNGQAGRVTRW